MPQNRPIIQILREAGGLGDVIRCLPVMTGLRQAHPDAELWVYGIDHYRPIWEHGEFPPDRFVPVTFDSRRPRDAPPDPARHAYLRIASPDLSDAAIRASPCQSGPVRVVDLYCPAWRHERSTGGRPYLDRIELFCQAAAVPPSTPRYVLHADEIWRGRTWLGNSEIELERPIVGLQCYSTFAPRNWPAESWHRLACELMGEGWQVLVFDCSPGRSRAIPGTHCTGRPLDHVAAVMSLCDLLITPDSGLFHLAAAVGTPCIGLFGPTGGDLIAKWYPHARVIQATADGLPCDPPCHLSPSRGYRHGACREHGCAALKSLPISRILDCLEKP